MMDWHAVLNADMATIGRWSAQGVDWWLSELRAMLPARLRRMGRRQWITAWTSGQDLVYRDDDGHRVIGLTSRQRTRTRLCLPSGMGLVRDLRLPPLSAFNLRQVVAQDLDRLSPFHADAVLFDLRIDNAGTPAQSVTVGIVPKSLAEQALAQAASLGLTPAALALADDDGRVMFDFLPALNQGRGAPRRRWLDPARLWLAAGGLLAVNLILFTVLDVLSVTRLENRLEELRPARLAAEKLRATVLGERGRHQDFMRRQRDNSPLPVLDALSQLLPDDVWVQRFDWDHGQIRLGGWARNGADPLALMGADPRFRDVQADTPGLPVTPDRAAQLGRAFAITATRPPLPQDLPERDGP